MRVEVQTREGRVQGNIVGTTRGGSLAIQLDGYSDLVYRKPGNIRRLPFPSVTDVL